MKEKVTVDIFEVIKHLEIDPIKAYRFLSSLQLKDTEPMGETDSNTLPAIKESKPRAKPKRKRKS